MKTIPRQSRWARKTAIWVDDWMVGEDDIDIATTESVNRKRIQTRKNSIDYMVFKQLRAKSKT